MSVSMWGPIPAGTIVRWTWQKQHVREARQSPYMAAYLQRGDVAELHGFSMLMMLLHPQWLCLASYKFRCCGCWVSCPPPLRARPADVMAVVHFTCYGWAAPVCALLPSSRDSITPAGKQHSGLAHACIDSRCRQQERSRCAQVPYCLLALHSEQSGPSI